MRFLRSRYAFPVFMSLLMVYGMETYNSILRTDSLSISSFIIPIPEWLFLSLIVYVLQRLFANPFSSFVNRLIWGGPTQSPVCKAFTFPVFILIVMCPAMSLVATVLFKYDRARFLEVWGQTTLSNLPMALVWQLIIVGPGLRVLFGRINAGRVPAGRA